MNMKSNMKKKVRKTKKKRRTAATVDDPNAPPKPKRNTGLNKPLVLSSTLAAFTGVSELSRPEVVKKLWKYIKEKDLQDPTDRRYILCDMELKKIFTQDRVNSFAMNRDLSAHLSKKSE
ncbi:SWIB/MDM2 domain-containing protein, partial [Umbelopsis sp. PMI_123]